MKVLLSILILCLVLSCNSKKSTPITQTDSFPFYVGTYTNKDSKGIYKYELNTDGTFKDKGLQAITENPSFLSFSADKKYLLAGNKLNPQNGTVSSFTIEADSLILQNAVTSGGVNPCFVTAGKNNYVLAANYGNGSIGLLQLNNDGQLSNILDIEQHVGKGTTSRQEGPHAHSAYFVPNSEEVISIDLGTNSLWFYKINTESNTLQPQPPLTLDMAPGAGPRHLTFHPNNKWFYVLNELNNTVTKVERLGAEDYVVKESYTTLPESFKGESAAADIHMSSDGKFLYASNRGHNSIAKYALNANDGTLTSIGFESSRGDTPRNFSLSPDEKFLVVAHRNSDNLVSFERNKETGLLTFVDEIKSPTPSCVLFQ